VKTSHEGFQVQNHKYCNLTKCVAKQTSTNPEALKHVPKVNSILTELYSNTNFRYKLHLVIWLSAVI